MNAPSLGNFWLLIGLLAYAAANVVVVRMIMAGSIQPPEGPMGFFTLVGPAVGVAVVLGVQLLSARPPFHWLAVLGFVAAMLVAAWLNYQALLLMWALTV